MGKERITFLCLFVVLIFISSSCHPRRASDIRPNMTKEEVVSSWGRTDLITYKTTNGTTLETWEYHFAGSGSICQITFTQDRVATTECRPSERRYYSQLEIQPYPKPYYYPQLYYYPYPYYYGGYYRYYRPYSYPYGYPYYRYRR